MTDATEAYREESDTIGQWILERVDAKEGATTNSTDAYRDYKVWAESRGDDRPFGNKGFSQGLDGRALLTDPDDAASERVTITKKRESAGKDKGKMFFQGFALRPLAIGRREG